MRVSDGVDSLSDNEHAGVISFNWEWLIEVKKIAFKPCLFEVALKNADILSIIAFAGEFPKLLHPSAILSPFPKGNGDHTHNSFTRL